MDLILKKAVLANLDMLISTRTEMLRIVNKLPHDIDFSEIEKNIRAYYISSFEQDTHVAYLAFDGEVYVGCGGISFYQVMPTYSNPTGRRAYIMNIYTVPKYRGKGIASQMVDVLVMEAHNRHIQKITLAATDMGRPVYAHYGFVPEHGAMELPCLSV